MNFIIRLFRKLFPIKQVIPEPIILPIPDPVSPVVIPPLVKANSIDSIKIIPVILIPKKKMINKEYFYQAIKEQKLFTSLTTKQVESMDTIINEWDLKGYTDLRWLAYMFATVYHETGRTMRPIEEYGKGAGRPYGKKIKHSGIVYTIPNKIYYGRGHVQLTWYENYELMGRLLKVDLLNNPELALDLKIATDIMFEGMTKGASSVGDFTGKCLEMYFSSTVEDWTGARKIINGTDKAELIASYGRLFLRCLKLQ